MSAVVIDISDMVQKIDNPPNRIREIRRTKRMTAQVLADMLGVKHNFVTRIETGARELTMGWAKLIAQKLEVPVADLLNDEDNPHRLNDEEQAVIHAMRYGDPAARTAVAQVAETLFGYRAQNDR